jgi:hypothetical protein
MAIVKHLISMLDGSSGDFSDRVIAGLQLGVPNAAGSGEGATVSTVVTFPEPLPPSFTVLVQCNQDAVAYVTSKTTFGFTVNIAPRLATETIAAGSFDVTVLG